MRKKEKRWFIGIALISICFLYSLMIDIYLNPKG